MSRATWLFKILGMWQNQGRDLQLNALRLTTCTQSHQVFSSITFKQLTRWFWSCDCYSIAALQPHVPTAHPLPTSPLAPFQVTRMGFSGQEPLLWRKCLTAEVFSAFLFISDHIKLVSPRLLQFLKISVSPWSENLVMTQPLSSWSYKCF